LGPVDTWVTGGPRRVGWFSAGTEGGCSCGDSYGEGVAGTAGPRRRHARGACVGCRGDRPRRRFRPRRHSGSHRRTGTGDSGRRAIREPRRDVQRGQPPDPEPAEIAAEIAKYRPQVAALQEICVRQTNDVRDILARTYGLRYDVAHGSVVDSFVRCGGTPLVDPGAFGNAILSAAPIRDKLVDKYPEGGSEDRGYVAATTRVDGESVRVFATHFAEAEQRDVRANQARYLADRASGFDRSIVLGDLNATPDAPELAPLWRFFRDADPNCGPQADGGRCQATHPGVNKKFDYILLRKGAYQPRGVGSHDNYSDHNLVHADIS
jgi:endonuclease/exonuclease/phosphatase family metal-dependent hydrolase